MTGKRPKEAWNGGRRQRDLKKKPVSDAEGDAGARAGYAGPAALSLAVAELHHDVRVLTSFIKFNKALTKFSEALTIPYHGLIKSLL